MSPAFPINTSILSSDALLERVLNRYVFKGEIECHFFCSRVNDTYIVETDSKTYYLRVYYYRWRSRRDIDAEIDLLLYLKKNKIPVSVPIQRKDGSYITRINAPEGIRYAVLFTGAEGRVPLNMNNKRSSLYGRLVGRIHNVTDRLDKEYMRFHIDLKHLIDDPLCHIESLLKHRKNDFNYLCKIGESLKLKIKKLLPITKPQYGICHGDHFGGNVFFNENDELTLFDFDCFGYGWRAYDIAVFLSARTTIGNWSEEANTKRTRRWNAFLKGYTQERELSDEEILATKIFVPIRQMWVLWLQTQSSERFGRAWMSDAYFDQHFNFIKDWIKNYKIL